MLEILLQIEQGVDATGTTFESIEREEQMIVEDIVSCLRSEVFQHHQGCAKDATQAEFDEGDHLLEHELAKLLSASTPSTGHDL